MKEQCARGPGGLWNSQAACCPLALVQELPSLVVTRTRTLLKDWALRGGKGHAETLDQSPACQARTLGDPWEVSAPQTTCCLHPPHSSSCLVMGVATPAHHTQRRLVLHRFTERWHLPLGSLGVSGAEESGAEGPGQVMRGHSGGQAREPSWGFRAPHLVQVLLQLVPRVLQLLAAAPEGQVHSVALQPQVLGGVAEDAVHQHPQVGRGQALALGAAQIVLRELGPGLRGGGAAGWGTARGWRGGSAKGRGSCRAPMPCLRPVLLEDPHGLRCSPCRPTKPSPPGSPSPSAPRPTTPLSAPTPYPLRALSPLASPRSRSQHRRPRGRLCSTSGPRSPLPWYPAPGSPPCAQVPSLRPGVCCAQVGGGRAPSAGRGRKRSPAGAWG